MKTHPPPLSPINTTRDIDEEVEGDNMEEEEEEIPLQKKEPIIIEATELDYEPHQLPQNTAANNAAATATMYNLGFNSTSALTGYWPRRKQQQHYQLMQQQQQQQQRNQPPYFYQLRKGEDQDMCPAVPSSASSTSSDDSDFSRWLEANPDEVSSVQKYFSPKE